MRVMRAGGAVMVIVRIGGWMGVVRLTITRECLVCLGSLER